MQSQSTNTALTRPLQPLLGAFTGLMVGMGVAMGSGIFRNPGLIAANTQSPIWILAAWCFGGLFFVAAGMLTAELSTRFPRAGGEYVYLREAYGDGIAMLFGILFTIFVIGSGIATMAVAAGEFISALLHLNGSDAWFTIAGTRYTPTIRWSANGAIGAGIIALVTLVNLSGLRGGSVLQNTLTLLKITALLLIVAAGVFFGSPIDWSAGSATVAAAATSTSPTTSASLPVLIATVAQTLMFVMWCYEGTTDSVKLSGEIRDPRRAMPRALIGAGVATMAIYLLLNWSFLRVLSPTEMAEAQPSVAAEVLQHMFHADNRFFSHGAALTFAIAALLVIGAISSTIIASVRVPLAMARDGLLFRRLGGVSASQAPTAALILSAVIAISFTFLDSYQSVLTVYTIATGVLFGLVNLSLLVFRIRDRQGVVGNPDHYRCPIGPVISIGLAVTQFAIASIIAYHVIAG